MATNLQKPPNSTELLTIFSTPGEKNDEQQVGIMMHPSSNPQMLIEVLEYVVTQLKTGGQGVQPMSAPANKFPSLINLIRN